jgi:hypothetical protein
MFFQTNPKIWLTEDFSQTLTNSDSVYQITNIMFHTLHRQVFNKPFSFHFSFTTSNFFVTIRAPGLSMYAFNREVTQCNYTAPSPDDSEFMTMHTT